MAPTRSAHDYLWGLSHLAARHNARAAEAGDEEDELAWVSVDLCRAAGLELHPECVEYFDRYEDFEPGELMPFEPRCSVDTGAPACMERVVQVGHFSIGWDRNHDEPDVYELASGRLHCPELELRPPDHPPFGAGWDERVVV